MDLRVSGPAGTINRDQGSVIRRCGAAGTITGALAAGAIAGIAEGGNAVVHEQVEDHAQGVDVGRVVIALSQIDLGGHVLDGACAGHGHPFMDGVHCPGDPEIPELVSRPFAVVDIACFDVAVQDAAFFTGVQRRADIHAHPQDFSQCHTA